jgi:APA family basic amino acid/polyamine antiporter
VIQTGTIAAVGVAFAKFTAYLFPIVSDKNILYEIGDFNLNAAQLFPFSPSFYSVILIVVGQNSKTLQTFLTVIKILSLAGLIVSVFLLQS